MDDRAGALHPRRRQDVRAPRHAGRLESDQEWGFAVEHDGRFAGTVSLRNHGDGRGEVAFGSHPEVRGKGVLSRALRLLLEWGFSPAEDGGRGLETVLWMANIGNLDSRRLAWSVGFSFDGTLQGWLNHRGEMIDAWAGTVRRGAPLSPSRPWLESPTIRGRAVVLREPAEHDLPRIVETLDDPETQFWLRRPREGAPHTLESQARLVTDRLADAADGRAVHWAVTDPETDAYLGQVSLFDVEHRRQAEIAYWAHPDARGRGVITEATRLVVRHCFVPVEDGGLGMARLTINAAVGNHASLPGHRAERLQTRGRAAEHDPARGRQLGRLGRLRPAGDRAHRLRRCPRGLSRGAAVQRRRGEQHDQPEQREPGADEAGREVAVSGRDDHAAEPGAQGVGEVERRVVHRRADGLGVTGHLHQPHLQPDGHQGGDHGHCERGQQSRARARRR